jgi:hypothetical protein
MGVDHMSDALKYMIQQRDKHRLNFDREACRKGVTAEQLENISKKIHYYDAAAEALRKVEETNEKTD